MFGISFEHLLILGVVLLIFGPRRLPELGNALGKTLKSFKEALAGVEDDRAQKEKLLTDESRRNNP
jgi:sec-independent protein translocase protein TatA